MMGCEYSVNDGVRARSAACFIFRAGSAVRVPCAAQVILHFTADFAQHRTEHAPQQQQRVSSNLFLR